MACRPLTFVHLSLLIFNFSYFVSGDLMCEDLPIDICAFAVSSAGTRCILEKEISSDGEAIYFCQTSKVDAIEFTEWIETDDCMQACGIDRMTLGISSDALVDSSFLGYLCSKDCHNNCPNVVELFEKLSEEEGAPLKRVCDQRFMNAARQEGTELHDSHRSSFFMATKNTWPASSTDALPPTYSFLEFVTADAPSPS
ncbi:hypothetical protein KP509_07G060300 [Ceratopteris richardii]|uniref:PAR1 protein n=1 Tax=Ceratopteris richardii TaxID=49495 RepID=A0A8T2UIQ5_CERRI|nr:hypothetical protein KP509_07G060300 [Ceratopteris richardii]